MAAFFTIGHSTRSLDEFIALISGPEVKTVADVRSVPRSRTNPQFNAEVMPQALGPAGIDYVHIAELGGLRGRQKGGGKSPNLFWKNTSFRNYADYAASDAFRTGLRRLQEIGHARSAAIMCAEAVWWRCHRRIIADYLLAEGETVFHILAANNIQPARLTPAVQITPEGTLIYRSNPSVDGLSLT